MSNRHVTDSSLDFCQREDVFHQLRHFGTVEIFDLRGKALNRAAQIAKTMGALLSLAFLQILLSVLQTLQLVLFLCKLCLDLFLFGSEINPAKVPIRKLTKKQNSKNWQNRRWKLR